MYVKVYVFYHARNHNEEDFGGFSKGIYARHVSSIYHIGMATLFIYYSSYFVLSIVTGTADTGDTQLKQAIKYNADAAFQ